MRITAVSVILTIVLWACATYLAYLFVIPYLFNEAETYAPLFVFAGASFLSCAYIAKRDIGIGFDSIFIGLLAAVFTFLISIALIVLFYGS